MDLADGSAMDTDKIKIFGARVRVDGTGKLAELERAEREKMKAKVAAIADHGITCFVNRQLIYNYPENLLAEAGIMSIEHADFEGVERLALVTGGEIASTFDAPDKVKIGRCEVIEEIMIGEDKVSCRLLAACISHFSSSSSLAWQRERPAPSFFEVRRPRWWKRQSGLCTTLCPSSLKPSKRPESLSEADVPRCSCRMLSATMLPAWSQLTFQVEESARTVKGKKALAVEGFARALRQLPTILADNGGYDSSDLVTQLRAAHFEGRSDAGLGA